MSSSRKVKSSSSTGPALVFKTWEEKDGKLIPSKRPRTKRGQLKPEVEIGSAPKDVPPKVTIPQVHLSPSHTPQETALGEAPPLPALNEEVPGLATDNDGGDHRDTPTTERCPPLVRC